jgi:hypothetical protein
VAVTVVRTGSDWQVVGMTICAAYATIGLLERCP